MTDTSHADLREQVRSRYAAAASTVRDTAGQGSCCPPVVEPDNRFGSTLYAQLDRAALPVAAVAASLGCGNPTTVAHLHPGERVLDLGSGGGIDVLLSAKQVGESGHVYGVDMTSEMLDLARGNAAEAGATNVEFVQGTIEDIPLPDGAVDVVISNCVINLSVDKPKVIAEMFRVLRPGGRISISDVVSEDHLTPDERAERGSFVGCIAGALSRGEYLDGLTAVGFADGSVRFTQQVADGMHNATIQATKSGGDPILQTVRGDDVVMESSLTASPMRSACCDHAASSTCCSTDAKASCCGNTATSSGQVDALPLSCGCR